MDSEGHNTYLDILKWIGKGICNIKRGNVENTKLMLDNNISEH